MNHPHSRAIDPPSVALAIFLWMFALYRPLWQAIPQYSGLILAGSTAALLGLSLLGGAGLPRKYQLVLCGTAGATLTALLLDTIVRPNDLSISTIGDFVQFGLIPIFIASRTQCARCFLITFGALSLPALAIYAIDPLRNYAVSGDYMTFGFQGMLPTLIGLIALAAVIRKPWIAAPVPVVLVLMGIYANRMATLVALAFILILLVRHFRHPTPRQALGILTFSALMATLVLNVRPIIHFAVSTLNGLGISSYSLRTLEYTLQTGVISDAGRLDIYSAAWDAFNLVPVAGSGARHFESVNGTYPHNIFLDILVSYGIIGFLALTVIIIRVCLSFWDLSDLQFLLYLSMFAMGFLELLTSTTLWQHPAFWVLVSFSFLYAGGRPRQDGSGNANSLSRPATPSAEGHHERRPEGTAHA